MTPNWRTSKLFARQVTHCRSYLAEAEGNEWERPSQVKCTSVDRSILQALDVIGSATEKESDAHTTIANVLLQQISIPLKNLTENQTKDRKAVGEPETCRLSINISVALCFSRLKKR